MPDDNKKNLVYFESTSMRGFYEAMRQWQEAHSKRLLSTSIEGMGGSSAASRSRTPVRC